MGLCFGSTTELDTTRDDDDSGGSDDKPDVPRRKTRATHNRSLDDTKRRLCARDVSVSLRRITHVDLEEHGVVKRNGSTSHRDDDQPAAKRSRTANDDVIADVPRHEHSVTLNGRSCKILLPVKLSPFVNK